MLVRNSKFYPKFGDLMSVVCLLSSPHFFQEGKGNTVSVIASLSLKHPEGNGRGCSESFYSLDIFSPYRDEL